jgi:cytochrome c biogenesis factor
MPTIGNQINFAKATTNMLQEYTLKLEQEIAQQENEYASQKGFFSFLWESTEQKKRRLHIAELKKERYAIEATIKNAHLMSKNAMIDTYRTMLNRLATFAHMPHDQVGSITISTLANAIQSRMSALEHTP